MTGHQEGTQAVQWVTDEEAQALRLQYWSLDPDALRQIDGRALALQDPVIRQKVLAILRPIYARALAKQPSPSYGP
jgi:hypothetical protein